MTNVDQERAVLAAESERQTALVAVDLAALDRLLAEDLVHVHSTGLVHSKQELLAHIDRKRGLLGITRGPLTVRIEGSVAVIFGAIQNRMRRPNEGEEMLLNGFVTQVLRLESDGWKFTNFQFTVARES